MNELARKLRSKEISLNEAIKSCVIPGHILRHFACDCAERALMREMNDGRKPHNDLWNAVKAARLYAEGKKTKDALKEVSSSVLNISADMAHHYSLAGTDEEANIRYYSWSAACSVYWSTCRHENKAASCSAAWSAALFNGSDLWQINHLVDLIELYLEERSKLARLLLYHVQKNNVKLWQEASLSNLFED